MRQFGERLSHVHYVDRPSAYAVIFRGAGEVAVVSTPHGCFLPGGGIESGETPMQTIIRESLEECGLQIRVIKPVGCADQFVFTPGSANGWCKRSEFFLAEINAPPCERKEIDHSLIWLARKDAVARLAHESQRWAVREAAAEIL